MMDPEKWARVKAVFHSALDRPAGDRAAFLDGACPDDPELRSEVESLLAQATGDSFLDRPAWEPSAPSPLAAREGRQSPAGPDAEQRAFRRHPFVWVVWLTAVVVAACWGYAAWRAFQDAAFFGWSEARRGAGWQVAAVTPGGPAAGKLQPGDMLLGLNGDAYVARGGTVPYRRVMAPGADYEIEVRRAGAALEYSLRTGGRRRYNPVGYAMGVAWPAIGLFIGFARPENALARLAFLACNVTGLGFLGILVLMPLYALQPWHVLGYHFFYLFPGDPPRARGWKWLLAVLYLATVVCTACGLLAKWLLLVRGPQAVTPLMAGAFGMPLDWLLTSTAVVSMLAAAVVAVHKYRALTDEDQRRRFRWVALGGVVGLGPVAVWLALDFARGYPAVARWLPSGSTWTLVDQAANFSSVVLPVCGAYAVVRHRVFDARIVIRRGIQYLLARRALQMLLALPVLALAYTLVTQRQQTLAELATKTSAYIYWIVALGLSLRFRAPLLQWLDQRFFREQYDREQVVLSLVNEFAQFDSAEEISDFVLRQLERSLHPKSMHFWRRKGGLMRVTDTADPSLESARLPMSDALLENLKRLGPVVSVPLPVEAGASSGEARWLTEGDARLLVLVAGDERVEGVLMLGEKQSEDPYSTGDINLLRAVAQETGVILDNFQLKRQVRDEQRIRHDVLAKLDQDLVSVMRQCPACGACYDSRAERCDRDGQALILTLPVPRTIDGKYRLDRLIGRGGMGAVYEARDLRLAREVAVKVMLGGEFGRETALRRFRREAQVVARLNHPNIVALYDFGELEGGGAYLVMERVAGSSLRAEMKRVGAFAPAEVAEWFDQMLDGLAAAHEHGIVHRDFKPENVLGARRASGALAVKILDFGLAKIRPLPTADPSSHSVTESGVVLGTLAYMAPEQLSGKEVDQRADIFAAGVILVEMLTGRRPSVDGASERAEWRLPAGFPSHVALDAVLSRCLAEAPTERFVSAVELRGALIPALRDAFTARLDVPREGSKEVTCLPGRSSPEG